MDERGTKEKEIKRRREEKRREQIRTERKTKKQNENCETCPFHFDIAFPSNQPLDAEEHYHTRF